MQWTWCKIYHLEPTHPGVTRGKEPTCQCRRPKRCRFNPWVGKIPWRRAWQPLQRPCLENPTDRGAWRAAVQRVAKIQTRKRRLRTNAPRTAWCPRLSLPINTSVMFMVLVLILPLLKAVNVVFVKLEVLPSEFYILSFIMNCKIKELVPCTRKWSFSLYSKGIDGHVFHHLWMTQVLSSLPYFQPESSPTVTGSIVCWLWEDLWWKMSWL